MNVSGYQAQAVLFAARPLRLALQQLELDGKSRTRYPNGVDC